MKRITRQELRTLECAARKEFPGDPALQQVHVARKVLAREARLNGVSYLEYVRLVARGEQLARRRRAG